MSHRYTDAEIDFLKGNCKGITTYELIEIFNKHFNIDLTRSQIRACMKNHKITSDIDRKLLNQFHVKKYTKEQENFIKENIEGKNTNQLTEEFNNYFGLNLKSSLIRAFIKNNKFKSDLDCQFKKGQTPSNKGTHIGGWEPTQFKKGNTPTNLRPVGSERVSVDGYTEVKVSEPNKWRLKQHVVWEKHNSPIPKGMKLVFGDGDRSNFDPNNLILVSNLQLLTLNRHKLIQKDADLTRTGVIIADIYQKISEREKLG